MHRRKKRVDWRVRVGGFIGLNASEILNLGLTTLMVSNFDAFFRKYLKDYEFREIYS